MNPFEPEPSFEERINELHRQLGRHPAYKDQWGRDPEDSDSENDLSDETMERLYQEDERKRFEPFKGLQGKGNTGSVPKAGGNVKKKEEKERFKEREEKNNEKKRRIESASPLPLPVEPPSPKKRKRLLSFSPEPSTTQLDHPSPPPPPIPVAGPSGHNSNKRTNPVSSPPPLPPPPLIHKQPTPEILELSSDDADDERLTKKKKKQTSTKTKPKKTAPSKSTSTTTTKGKGKSQPRKSMEQVIEAVNKIKDEQLKTHFTDISSFIDHLSPYEMEVPGKLLQGCRILFVNTDHWLANRGVNGRRNRFDFGLRLEMTIVVKRGGTLIKPEDFVASPQDTTLQEMGDEEMERRAEEEGWTSHIIGFSPSQQRSPNFTEILKCLGKTGIKAKDLGPYVKVIKFDWVSQSYLRGKRQSEWEFAIEPDPRVAIVASSRSSSTKSSPTKKSVKDRRQGRRRGPEEDGDTTGGSEGEDDEAVIRGISPFGTQDYPIGEKPSLIAQSDKGKGKAVSDPEPDDDDDEPITSTCNNPLEGLEAQSKLVKELGDEEFDRELDQVEREPDSMIYTGVNDDCETENEEEEEEKKKEAKKNGSEYKASRWDEKRSDRAGYVVNQDFVPRGQNEGPNDHTADVLMRLSELHKGDQWRERGYRTAAGFLRRHKTKVTTYEKLRLIRGIGDSIANKIVEIVQTGSHRKLENELPQEKAARSLSGIYGIGLARGRELAIKGVKTVEDLKRPEYFSELTEDQQIGLKYYDDLLSRIPRAEVTKLYEVVLDAAKRVDPKLQVECMGSYRRRQPDSGDIDILVTRDPTLDGKTHSGAIGKMHAILQREGFFKHILSQSDDWSDLHCKVNGLCQLDENSKMRRIDILGVPWDDMPAAMIYFTGNDHYNRSLRLKARHMGYSLNQKCLSKSLIRDSKGEKMTEGTRVPGIKTEQDIFRILKVPYKKPEERIPS